MRILIADPQPIFVRGLEHVLREVPDFEVVGVLHDSVHLLAEIGSRRPEVLLIDPAICSGNPFAIVQQIASLVGGPKIILVAGTLRDEDVFQAVRIGVAGLLLKSMSAALVIQCLRKVHGGERWLEKESTGRAIESLLKREERLQETVEALTRREMEVLRVASSGCSNRTIADRLCISEGTVKMHLRSVYEKLGLRGRAELIIYARENRLASDMIHARP